MSEEMEDIWASFAAETSANNNDRSNSDTSHSSPKVALNHLIHGNKQKPSEVTSQNISQSMDLELKHAQQQQQQQPYKEFRTIIEFARSFIALSLFQMCDIWTLNNKDRSHNNNTDLRLTNVSTILRHDILTDLDHNTDWISLECLNSMVTITPGDGCVGRAYCLKKAIWTSTGIAALADFHRSHLLEKVGIVSALSVPIFVEQNQNENINDNVSELKCILTFYSTSVVPRNEHFVVFMTATVKSMFHASDPGTVKGDMCKKRSAADMNVSPQNQNIGFDLQQDSKKLKQNFTIAQTRQRQPPLQQKQHQQQQPSSTIYSARKQVISTSTPAPVTGITKSALTARILGAPRAFDPTISSLPPVCQVVGAPLKSDLVKPMTMRPHQDPNICRVEGCKDPISALTHTQIPQESSNLSRKPYTYCVKHNVTPRYCEYPSGCTKCAQGSTRFCIAHGGGRRCTFQGCDRGARDKFFCAAHGGGKRCSHPTCNKSAVGGSNLCTSHGGGKRCSFVDPKTGATCSKSAQASTEFCVKHGGGRKCKAPGCEKVARGRTAHCASHGGGVRCREEGCNRVAIGRKQLCRAHQQKKQCTVANVNISVTSNPKKALHKLNAIPDMVMSNQESAKKTVGESALL